MKLKGTAVGLIILILIAGFVCTRYYSYVFARNVSGEVVGIDRVTQPTAIIAGGGAIPRADIFSFAVAIKDEKGEIVTASSEDRQWAVVEKGQCAEAKFFPYPPWDLDKAGTYFNARLVRLSECGKDLKPAPKATSGDQG